MAEKGDRMNLKMRGVIGRVMEREKWGRKMGR